MFGKLNDGSIVFAPKMLSGDGVNVYNPPAEMYAEQGWKSVRTTKAPESPPGYHYEGGWEETANEIVQTWTLTSGSEGIDEIEALAILLGEGGDGNA